MDATDRLFGEIAVKLGHLSREQLAECIRTQYDSPAGTPLGQIALSLGFMQPPEIEAVSAQQARLNDRRRAKSRPGIVEIDATQGANEERVERIERIDLRSSSQQPENASRNQARNARTQPNQPPIASAYRSPSNAKLPAIATRTVSDTPPLDEKKVDLKQTLNESPRPSRRADRTLVGTAADSKESAPAHEAITVIPPPDHLAAEPDTDASADPEVSFEALMSVVPRPPAAPTITASPAAQRQPLAQSSPTVPVQAPAELPHDEASFSGLDDPEISFGSLLSQAPRPNTTAGTIHGVGAPQPLNPPVPPARPRHGTLAFAAASNLPPMIEPIGGPKAPPPEPSPKRTGTVPSFAATPPPPDVVFSTPLSQEQEPAPPPPQRPTRSSSQAHRAQSLTPAQQAAQRAAARAPRRASAWFSSLPALVVGPSFAAASWTARNVVAAQDIKDAALAQLPAGAESIAVRALRAAQERGALDVHFHRAAPIMMRLHGELQPLLGGAPLGDRAVDKTLAQIMTDAQWKRLGDRGEVMFTLDIAELGRARVSASRSENGCDAMLRLSTVETRTLAELGLPTSLAKLLDYESGLIVCTGPIGHGVTTTMSALINGVVMTRQGHVVSLEEMIELRMPSTRCLVSQRQLGTHVNDMARAVRAVAHEDVDLIAIGDLRNAEDIALALSLSHGGHLVIAAAHARGTADCVNRLVRPFGKHDQAQARTMLAQSLRAVIGQHLVMRADGKGRVPAIELIVATPAISDLIRRGMPIDAKSLAATGKAQKLVTLEESLQRLVAAGTVDAAEAEQVARNMFSST